MQKISIITAIISAVCLSTTAGFGETKKAVKIDGKQLFAKHCAACHPNGGNIVNAQKSLDLKARKANGVNSAKDIVAKIRKPGPGMNSFDEKTISSKEAKAIAEYILKTFK